MYRSDDPGGVELRFSILSIYARVLPIPTNNESQRQKKKNLCGYFQSFLGPNCKFLKILEFTNVNSLFFHNEYFCMGELLFSSVELVSFGVGR